MAYPVLAPQDTWFTNGASAAGVTKVTITEIGIVDSYTPTSTNYKSWDASDGNGGVSVYVEGTKLTIAGNGSGKVMANPDSERLFRGFTALTTFDSGVFDTSNATTLYYVFYDCSSIEYLDLTTWNTAAVTSLRSAFNGMYKLKTLLVYNWNTSNVTTMRSTFQCSSAMEVLDLSGWVVDNVENMRTMFAGLTNYGGAMSLSRVIGIENWNVSKVTDMTGMFNLNSKMEVVDFSKWNNAACTTTNLMLCMMSNLKKIVIGPDFRFCGSSPYVDGDWYTIGGVVYPYNSIPTQGACTYYADKSMVENLDVLVKNKVLLDTANAIRSKTGIQTRLKPSEFDEAICYPTLSASFLAHIKKETSVETLRFVSMYDATTAKTSWPADELAIGAITGYLDDKTVIISANGASKIRLPANSSGLFADLPLLKTIGGLEILDVSCVKFLGSAFSNCSSLLQIDLSGLDFGDNLIGYDRLFAGCYRLETVTLWNGVSFVAPGMFNGCLNLQEISGLSGVTVIGEGAFIHATNLVNVDIDASKVVSIGAMACRRSNIEDLIDFAQSPLQEIGTQSIRSDRWSAAELSAIQHFFDGKSYGDVYIDVPHHENQYNYPHTMMGYDGDNGPVSMATWGCSMLATYHEWNAVYNAHGITDKVYPDFLSWWSQEVLARDPDYAETNDVNTSTLAEVRELLGWKSAAREFVQSVDQLATIADRLAQGLPLYASVYSTNTLGGMHGVLIVGMKPSEGKIAILDSSVVGHTGVVSWVRFEDLFVKGVWKGDGSDTDKYYGVDSIRLVSDYNLPDVSGCVQQHFVQNFVGDGGTSRSFQVPFEPDFIQIFCFDPTVINKASVLASFFYDQRAFGLYAGTYQYGSGSGSLKNGAFSTTSASTRYVRAEDGTITVKDFASNAAVVYGAGLPYTIIAVKYAEQSDKERITSFVNGLTGSGSVTLNQAKVNAAFTADEWAELIGTKPNWTFNLVV